MANTKNQDRRFKNTSRREFLKKAAKGSSIAALIAGGVLDLELREILLAEQRIRTLSKEALDGSLPNTSLETIRNILKGKFYTRGSGGIRVSRGRDGLSYCNGEYNNGGCQGQNCRDHQCDNQTCPTGYQCRRNECENQICGGQDPNCPNHWSDDCPEQESGSRSIIPEFDLGDIPKHAGSGSGSGGGSGGGSGSNFLDEMMEIRGFDIKALETEIKDMIINRETFKDRGYIR